MRTTNSNIEIKRQNKIKIVQYILKHEKVSNGFSECYRTDGAWHGLRSWGIRIDWW